MITTNIKEKYSDNFVAIEGDLKAALRACLRRNETFKREGIRGEWSPMAPLPFEPHEYRAALTSFGWIEEGE